MGKPGLWTENQRNSRNRSKFGKYGSCGKNCQGRIEVGIDKHKKLAYTNHDK